MGQTRIQEIIRCYELNQTKNTKYQSSESLQKPYCTRRKFRAGNAYIRKDERFEISDLNFYLKELEGKHMQPKLRRRKKRISENTRQGRREYKGA